MEPAPSSIVRAGMQPSNRISQGPDQSSAVMSPTPSEPGAPSATSSRLQEQLLRALERPWPRRLVFGSIVLALVAAAALSVDIGWNATGTLLFTREPVDLTLDAPLREEDPSAITAVFVERLIASTDGGPWEAEVTGETRVSVLVPGEEEVEARLSLETAVEQVRQDLELITVPRVLMLGEGPGAEGTRFRAVIEVDPRQIGPLMGPGWQGARTTGYYGELLEERTGDRAFVDRATGQQGGTLFLAQERWDPAPVRELFVGGPTSEMALAAFDSSVVNLREELSRLQRAHGVAAEDAMTLAVVGPPVARIDPVGSMRSFFFAVGAVVVSGIWLGLAAGSSVGHWSRQP